MNENITVLKDESLGGIEREYREVKRKANVGERIKIVKRWPLEDRYDIGDVFVTSSVRQSDGYARVDSLGERVIALEEYVVLEPTDIIRIDGERLRMVDRKAAVGERVIVVNPEDDNSIFGGYKVGDIATITFTDTDSQGTYYGARLAGGKGIAVYAKEYRVLEPVESAKSAEPTAPLSAQPPLDQAAANIAALTAKVQALESRVDTLEKAKQAVKVAEGPADDAPPSFAGMPRAKSLQQIRDEIVERTKDDVKALLSQNYPDIIECGVWFAEEMSVSVTDECEFVVDRDKRTVVALIRELESGKKTVILRGIAKAAPNDVFNAHIGRAIALRRALGLEVPAEYLNVPNPEEPRVGDVVDEVGGMNRKGRVVREMRPRGFGLADEGLTFEGLGWAFIRDCKIIDDSREEVGA